MMYRHFVQGEAGVEILSTPVSSGLWSWHDAADESTITVEGGERVTNWADKSGNGRDVAAVAGGSHRPYSGTRSLNGSNVIDFRGGQRLYFPSGQHMCGGDNTVIFLYRSDSTGIHRVLTGYSNIPNATYAAYKLTTVASDSANIRWAACQNISPGGNSSIITGSPDTSPHICGYVRNGSILNCVMDDVYGGDVAATDVSLTAAMQLGACYAGSSSFIDYLDGFIAEILIYERALTPEEVSENTAYLQQKWGL